MKRKILAKPEDRISCDTCGSRMGKVIQIIRTGDEIHGANVAWFYFSLNASKQRSKKCPHTDCKGQYAQWEARGSYNVTGLHILDKGWV